MSAAPTSRSCEGSVVVKKRLLVHSGDRCACRVLVSATPESQNRPCKAARSFAFRNRPSRGLRAATAGVPVQAAMSLETGKGGEGMSEEKKQRLAERKAKKAASREAHKAMVEAEAKLRYDKQLKIWNRLKKGTTPKKLKKLWIKMLNRAATKVKKREAVKAKEAARAASAAARKAKLEGSKPEAKMQEEAKKEVKQAKQEKEEEEAEDGRPSTSGGNDKDSGKKERKDKKKKEKKKNKKREAEEDGDKEEEEDAAAAAQDGGEAEEQKQGGEKSGGKDGKKKSKKQKTEEAGEEEQPVAAAAGGHQGGKSKKHQGAAWSQESAPLAAVGDASLAKSLPAIKKALYKEHAEVTAMSAAQVESFRGERHIAVEGADVKPLTKFEHTGLPASMLNATRDFAQPSPIQAQCWPIALSGRDVIGIAATGSGKTLGFGLPMLRHISAQRDAGVYKAKGPFALVMAPTRELAQQIADVLEDAGKQCGCRVVCVYGGVPKTEQVAALKRGVEIVVGTPGRLEDLMNDGVCRLADVSYLVLDEADRMLDLGFEPHIRAICGKVRSDRQTLMFSATWPAAVQKLAANFLSQPVKVTIGSQDLSASHSIKQVVEVIEHTARDARLCDLLTKYHKSRTNRIIIFVLYKKEAPRVEALLQRRGWKCVAIHGDLSQQQRTKAVEQFKDGSVPLLIATDVAARGLDIPDVEVVINYSFPLTTEDYVHRIGRTGRAGKSGISHTFFVGVNDKPRAGELINVLKEAKQAVPEELLKFGTTVKKKESAVYGAHFKDVDFTAKASKVTFDDDD